MTSAQREEPQPHYKILLNEYYRLTRQVVIWSLIIAPVSFIIGSAVALFLVSLDRVTSIRFENPWLLYLLPAAGIVLAAVYHRFGARAERGNNLIVDEIHEPSSGVPGILAPLILVSTIWTHLFGGSAGREGTAVQMGGGIASTLGKLLKLDRGEMRILLICGIAAGFGSVFGTPLAGTIFALEVLTVGRIEYRALVPALFSAIIGNAAAQFWGIEHTAYHIAAVVDGIGAHNVLHFEWSLFGWAAAAGIVFGLIGMFFTELTHTIGKLTKRFITSVYLRPVIGGVVVIGLTYLIGSRDYLGLSVSSPEPNGITLSSTFHEGGADTFSWLWKILFTAVTLGTGFKGGEVTPLFFIGAAAGNIIAVIAGLPIDLIAGLGFIAVFAGASNTPIACTIMGVELFGAEYAIYFATACFMSYLFSGHGSIYTAQRIGVRKHKFSRITRHHPPQTTQTK